ALFPRAVSAGAAESWLEQRVEGQWRPDGERPEDPRWARQLRVAGSYGPWPLCRCNDVGTAEPGWLVGGRRRHVLHRRRAEALDRRNRVGRLLPRRMGFRRPPILVRSI